MSRRLNNLRRLDANRWTDGQRTYQFFETYGAITPGKLLTVDEFGRLISANTSDLYLVSIPNQTTIIDNGDGTLSVALPQDIDVGATPIFDTVNFGDVSSAITEDVSNNLSFTDAVTGTKTLAQLAAAGGSGGEIDRVGFSSVSSTVLVPGVKSIKVIPFDCTVDGWYIESSAAGDVEVDVYNDLQTPVSIIGAGNKPTLSAATVNSAAPSGWTDTTLSVGDILTFEIQSGVTVSNVVMTLDITKV